MNRVTAIEKILIDLKEYQLDTTNNHEMLIGLKIAESLIKARLYLEKELQEQTALEFTRWKDERYVIFGTFYVSKKSLEEFENNWLISKSDFMKICGRTPEQLFNEWNN